MGVFVPLERLVGWCDNPIIFAGCGHPNPIEMESSRLFCWTYNGKREET